MSKGGEFLKKLCCCVGGGVKHEYLIYQRNCINSVDKPNLPIKCFHFHQEKLSTELIALLYILVQKPLFFTLEYLEPAFDFKIQAVDQSAFFRPTYQPCRLICVTVDIPPICHRYDTDG